MGRLQDKVAIVTGAGSSGPGWGNGKATAVLFAREGARVLAVDVNRDAVDETCAIIRGEGHHAEPVVPGIIERLLPDVLFQHVERLLQLAPLREDHAEMEARRRVSRLQLQNLLQVLDRLDLTVLEVIQQALQIEGFRRLRIQAQRPIDFARGLRETPLHEVTPGELQRRT